MNALNCNELAFDQGLSDLALVKNAYEHTSSTKVLHIGS